MNVEVVFMFSEILINNAIKILRCSAVQYNVSHCKALLWPCRTVEDSIINSRFLAGNSFESYTIK